MNPTHDVGESGSTGHLNERFAGDGGPLFALRGSERYLARKVNSAKRARTESGTPLS